MAKTTASRALAIKKGAKVEDMYTLKKEDLQARLKGAKIPFEDGELKCNLQGLWALYNLGLLKCDGTADAALLARVSEWCKMLVRDRLAELEKLSLDVAGNKWDHVETVIRAECVPASSSLGGRFAANKTWQAR